MKPYLVLLFTTLVLPIVAFAQPPIPADAGNLGAWWQVIAYAVAHRQWRYVAGAALVLVVWAVRKVAPDAHFFNTDRGGALLTLLCGVGLAASAALTAAHFSWQFLVDGVGAAVMAAGGYNLLGKLGVFAWFKYKFGPKSKLPSSTDIALPKGQP